MAPSCMADRLRLKVCRELQTLSGGNASGRIGIPSRSSSQRAWVRPLPLISLPAESSRPFRKTLEAPLARLK